MKIKYIKQLKKNSAVCDYWFLGAYALLLKHARKSRKRKEFARAIIRICKGNDICIVDISDDYRFETAKYVYDNILRKTIEIKKTEKTRANKDVLRRIKEAEK